MFLLIKTWKVLFNNARLAQSVERWTLNPTVVGSSPTLGVILCVLIIFMARTFSTNHVVFVHKMHVWKIRPCTIFWRSQVRLVHKQEISVYWVTVIYWVDTGYEWYSSSWRRYFRMTKRGPCVPGIHGQLIHSCNSSLFHSYLYMLSYTSYVTYICSIDRGFDVIPVVLMMTVPMMVLVMPQLSFEQWFQIRSFSFLLSRIYFWSSFFISNHLYIFKMIVSCHDLHFVIFW